MRDRKLVGSRQRSLSSRFSLSRLERTLLTGEFRVTSKLLQSPDLRPPFFTKEQTTEAMDPSPKTKALRPYPCQ